MKIQTYVATSVGPFRPLLVPFGKLAFGEYRSFPLPGFDRG